MNDAPLILASALKNTFHDAIHIVGGIRFRNTPWTILPSNLPQTGQPNPPSPSSIASEPPQYWEACIQRRSNAGRDRAEFPPIVFSNVGASAHRRWKSGCVLM